MLFEARSHVCALNDRSNIEVYDTESLYLPITYSSTAYVEPNIVYITKLNAVTYFKNKDYTWRRRKF